MGQKKAIFLDKDGTIIPDVPYNVNPDLISLQPGVIEGLQLLQKHNFLFIVISNQAGVARGYFQRKDLVHVETKLSQLLNVAGIAIAGFYFCPHHPQGTVPEYTGTCECRKPAPGMLLQAIREHDIDPLRSWMIGDTLNDVEAGNRAGCKTILVKGGNETEWVTGANRRPLYVATDFLDAATYIDNSLQSELPADA